MWGSHRSLTQASSASSRGTSCSRIINQILVWNDRALAARYFIQTSGHPAARQAHHSSIWCSRATSDRNSKNARRFMQTARRLYSDTSNPRFKTKTRLANFCAPTALKFALRKIKRRKIPKTRSQCWRNLPIINHVLKLGKAKERPMSIWGSSASLSSKLAGQQ